MLTSFLKISISRRLMDLFKLESVIKHYQNWCVILYVIRVSFFLCKVRWNKTIQLSVSYDTSFSFRRVVSLSPSSSFDHPREIFPKITRKSTTLQLYVLFPWIVNVPPTPVNGGSDIVVRGFIRSGRLGYVSSTVSVCQVLYV